METMIKPMPTLSVGHILFPLEFHSSMMNPSLEWVMIAAAIEEDPYDKFQIRELDPVELPREMRSSST